MKTLLFALTLFSALAFSATATMATDSGQIPSDSLAEMGLAGMQPMTDLEGMDVRGKVIGKGGITIILSNVNIAYSRPGSIAIAGARNVNITLPGRTTKRPPTMEW